MLPPATDPPELQFLARPPGTTQWHFSYHLAHTVKAHHYVRPSVPGHPLCPAKREACFQRGHRSAPGRVSFPLCLKKTARPVSPFSLSNKLAPFPELPLETFAPLRKHRPFSTIQPFVPAPGIQNRPMPPDAFRNGRQESPRTLPPQTRTRTEAGEFRHRCSSGWST